MTSPPQSSQNADDLNAAFKELEIGGVPSTYPDGERHDQYLVSTKPCGFSFMGQFRAEPGITDQSGEKKATETFTKTPITAKITNSHLDEINKAQEEAAYQKAVKECSSQTPHTWKIANNLFGRRREKYLPSYGHFLPVKRVPRAGEVSPKEARKRGGSPSGVRTNDVDGTRSDQEMDINDQLK